MGSKGPVAFEGDGMSRAVVVEEGYSKTEKAQRAIVKSCRQGKKVMNVTDIKHGITPHRKKKGHTRERKPKKEKGQTKHPMKPDEQALRNKKFVVYDMALPTAFYMTPRDVDDLYNPTTPNPKRKPQKGERMNKVCRRPLG